MKPFSVVTRSPLQTHNWGRKLGRLLAGGEIIGLSGELGSGKSCFVRGMAEGLEVGKEAWIRSPTFTLINEHQGRLPLYHIDLYRVESRREMEELDLPGYLFSDGVSVIEWFEHLPAEEVEEHLRVAFAHANGNKRKLTFTAHGERYDKIIAGLRVKGSKIRNSNFEIRNLGGEEGRARMALIVQKYGGTSVGTVERIKDVAKKVAAAKQQGNDVVVVVSAMAGETNRLVALAQQLSESPDERECDVLLASGEQVSSSLLSLAIQNLGCRARSFLGHQVRIETDKAYGKARIKSIDSTRIKRALKEGEIVVVAGFQGVDEEDNITTLGRGGSDTSAVAMAAALKAKVCEIYTDVEGVFTTDPSVCPEAKKLNRISFEEMIEMASTGAKVLQIRSVELAMKFAVPIHVRSSFNEAEGTWVVEEDEGMDEVLVSGVTYDKNEAKITLLKVPDRPGLAAQIFSSIAEADIVVDMIIQNASEDGTTDLTFTVPKSDYKKAVSLIEKSVAGIQARGVKVDPDIAKVSIVGVGMRTHAGVAAKMFQILAREGINIEMISTSEIKISVVIDEKQTERAVRALHKAFIEKQGNL